MLAVKNPSTNAGDSGDLHSIPGSGRCPGEGNGNPLQYCLRNPMDRGARWATVHGVAKSQTWLNNWSNTKQYVAEKDKWKVYKRAQFSKQKALCKWKAIITGCTREKAKIGERIWDEEIQVVSWMESHNNTRREPYEEFCLILSLSHEYSISFWCYFYNHRCY